MRDRRGDFGLANVDEDDFVVSVPPGLIGRRSPRGIAPCLAAHEQFDHVELSEVGDPVELAHAEGVSCPGYRDRERAAPPSRRRLPGRER